MRPRFYQSESVDNCFLGWETARTALVESATGTGKTKIAAMCAERVFNEWNKRVLFIVHLREIVRQSKKAIAKMTSLAVGMELSSEHSSSLDPEPIICASVQTLNGRKRLAKFDPNEFGLIIADEGHHLTGETWQNVFRYFPNAKVLVLSATPERADKKKIGAPPKEGETRVDFIAYSYPLKQACDDGFLVKPRQLTIEIPGLDFRKIPRKQGELAKEELERIMIKYATECAQKSLEAIFDLFPHELDNVAESEWNTYIGDRIPKKTLIFCVSRLHADKVRNALNSFREGLCGYVDGETPHIERRDVLGRFGERHGLAVLANCGVTTEGYDNNYIQLILDMAPTMSQARALQKWGRGTRTLPGTLDGLDTVEERLKAIASSEKPHIIIADFTDNSRDHRLITLLDIFGADQPTAVKREVEKRMKDRAIDVEEEVQLVLKERYELRHSNYIESEIDGFTGKKKKKRLTKEQKEARRLAREKQPISDKQWQILEHNKLHPENRSLEENKYLLKTITHRRLAGLCTYRQGFTLMKYGYTKTDMERMTFREASAAIDAIAQNGWKRKAVSNY